MTEIRKEWKRHLFERNPILCCRMHGIFTYLGVGVLVIGIISDAMNKVLGLEPSNWFIMTVLFWMGGYFAWFRGY